MIKFENVNVQYIKDFSLLYNANYLLENNTIFFGDEFSGSTAILRLIAKIEKNYTGEIYIDDKNIKEIKDQDLSVAYVCETPTLFKFKSIFSNLYYPLKIRKFDKKFAKNLIENSIEKYKINTFQKSVRKMNLSEKLILTLLRASLWKPKYLLIENIFGKIEEKYYNIVENLISDIQQNSTIIACEKVDNNLKIYNNFNKIIL